MSKKRKRRLKKPAVQPKPICSVRMLSALPADEKGRLHGLLMMNEVTVLQYTLIPQNAESEYAYLGEVTPIEPALSCAKEPVFVEVCVTENSAEAISTELLHAAQELFAKYTLRFVLQSEKVGVVSEVSFSVVLSWYWDRFCGESLKCAEKQKNKIFRELDRVGELLGAKRLRELKCADIECLKAALGEPYDRYISSANRFLEYLRKGCGIALPNNCFAQYMDTREYQMDQRNKREKRQNKEVVRAEWMSNEEEAALDAKISANIDDGEMIGVLVVKETLFSTRQACKLKWKDLLIDEDGIVRIQHRHSKEAWTGYDMTFVCSAFFSQEIRRRKEWVMRQLLDDQQPDDLPVVTRKTDFRRVLKSSDLNACCRRMVENTKCYANMVSRQKDADRAGVELIHRTMHHRLEEKCFLRDDPGLMDFLQHHLPKSTLERYYRSHTDLAAIHRVKVIMQRDPRTKQERTEKENQIREEMLDDGGRKITIPAAYAGRRNQVFVRLKLLAGSEMAVTARHGVMMEMESKN